MEWVHNKGISWYGGHEDTRSESDTPLIRVLWVDMYRDVFFKLITEMSNGQSSPRPSISRVD